MGKSSIVYVIGLSMLIGIGLMNMSGTGTSSLDNYTAYYGTTLAHNIATAGANIGSSILLRDPTHSTPLVDQAFATGFFDVYFAHVGDSAYVLSTSSVDISGLTMRDTVEALFRLTQFAKYGWFTDKEVNGYVGSPYYGANDWKITGDSVFGLAHTNYKFNLSGTPYFRDKVTATLAPTRQALAGIDAPVFAGNYQWGITVNRPPANLPNLKAIGQSGSGYVNNEDVALTFFNDGTLNRVIKNTIGTVLTNDTIPLSSLTSSGVYVVDGGDLRVTGTYKGKVTLVSLYSGSRGGNIWIDGNGIVAATDPKVDPNSPDMLGLVSQKSTFITRDDTRTPASVVNLEAAVYCQTGELTAQDFWLIGLHGRVNLFGGVTQATAGSLGVFTFGSGLIHGMFYSIYHDPRFMNARPPSFPVSDKYELVSWWEN